jgi:dihydrofolate synthase/folylpolyglutamate synthase
MDYRETVQWLCALRNRGARFGIDRMKPFAAALGHPERAFRSIHIAGSNGKGSTAAMLEAMYRAKGVRTGLYTSPHLVRLGERVRVNGVELGEAALCAHVARLAPVAAALAGSDADMAPTFFEFMTAMAFLEFRERGVDVAIIETGLGGRLDATNIIRPSLSVITSISREHTEYLGGTLEEIATEKGGIIKPGVPVAHGLLPRAAARVLRTLARACDAPLFPLQDNHGAFPETNLEGGHQRANAALALLATRILGAQLPVDEPVFRAALRAVNWPARWQRIGLAHERHLVVDATHNAEGAATLEPLLAQLARETGRAPLIVTGVLGLERARPLLGVLARHARSLHLVRPKEQERACGFAELEACIPAAYTGTVARASLDALFPRPGVCSIGAEGDTVVVTGSIYLAGEVLARIQPAAQRAETNLQDRLIAATGTGPALKLT